MQEHKLLLFQSKSSFTFDVFLDFTAKFMMDCVEVCLGEPFPVGLVYKPYIPLLHKSNCKRFLWEDFSWPLNR